MTRAAMIGLPRAALAQALCASYAVCAACSADLAATPEDIDFGGCGVVRSAESFRTPGVREGRIIDGPLAGGWSMCIDTSQGEVRMAQGPDGTSLYSLPAGEGARIVHEVAVQPGCGGALAPPSERGAEGSTAGQCDDGSVIDVLMKWTPLAEQGIGGATAMRALAEAAVAMSNHVYIASGVNVRMRAAGYGVTEPYAGDAGSGVIYELTDPDDGYMDAVHVERDATGADLVALLSGPNPSYCGIAWLVGQNAPQYGFSVTAWGCVAGLTMTHEVGHNQGCCHARGDGGGCNDGGVFPYSVGHRFVASNGIQYRTVMAYSPGTRIPRLSSPDVTFLGVPTGLVDANNARTVNETAQVMANYRCSVACADPPSQVESPVLDGPLPAQAASFTVPIISPAAQGVVVDIVVTAVGDYSDTNETMSLRIGSTSFGIVLSGTGTDCALRSRTTSVAASAFNAAIGGGNGVEFVLSASAAVTACAQSETVIALNYVPAPPACAGDLNRDGLVNALDLSGMLAAWGPCCGCIADISGSGAVEGKDLAYLLAAWGPCE